MWGGEKEGIDDIIQVCYYKTIFDLFTILAWFLLFMSKRQMIETHNLTERDSSENDCVGMGTNSGKGLES